MRGPRSRVLTQPRITSTRNQQDEPMLSPAAKASRGFVALNALLFIGLGLRALSEPAAHMAPFDLLAPSAAMLGEIRANYGGMHLAMGVLFLFGAWLEQWRRPALILIAAFCGGLVLGRLVSIGAEGWPNPFVTQLLVVEVVATAIAVALLVADRKMA